MEVATVMWPIFDFSIKATIIFYLFIYFLEENVAVSAWDVGGLRDQLMLTSKVSMVH